MIKVFVFPSCNEPGLEIVRSLIDQPDVEVYGGSCHPPHQDASAAILEKHVRLPMIDEPGFRQIFSSFIRDEQIDVVFPSMEKTVTAFSDWHIEGTKFVTPLPEVAAIAESKQKTYAALKNVIPVPDIYESNPPQYPAYGKPAAGSGGRDHLIIHDEEDLKFARKNGLLVTEYLPGNEIVAYNFNDLSGNHLLCITKIMGRWRGGASQLGELKTDPLVWDHASAISKKMRLVGPWFVQFKRDRNGTYKLMEVNARLGGAAGICRLAGINVPLITVRMFAGQPIMIPKHYPPMTWVRNLKAFTTMADFDQVVWDLSAFQRPKDKKLRPHVIAALFEMANRNVRQDCYGGSIPKALLNWRINSHFSCHYNTLADALNNMANASRTVFITDDSADQMAIMEKYLEIRVVSTSSIEVLGKEKM
jgi:hypothetical protein